MGVALVGTVLAAIYFAAPAACAQTPGQYAGLNSDGFGVGAVIYQPGPGQILLTYLNVTAYFYCDGKLLLTGGQKIPYGAASEMAAPFKNGVAKFAAKSNELGALTGTVQANGDTLSGSLTGYAALFGGSKVPPNDGEAKSCKTRDLRFTANFSRP